MRLELDLSADDWKDYAAAPLGDLKRVGVIVPTEDVGIRQFVRLGVKTDDGQLVTVMTPWLIWQAAHRALAERLGEDQVPTPPPAPEPAGVLADVQAAMGEHERRWGLGPAHDDGTSASWQDDAQDVRREATEAAVNDILTWGHTLLEATYAVMATPDPTDLRQALARVAGTAAAWMTAIDGRADG